MRITFVTLFPEMYENFIHTSIIGRSIEQGKVQVDFVQIRDFALDKYRHVDDTPFGGGAGMVMKCQPVIDALNSVRTPESYCMMMNPRGNVYTQKKARQLTQYDHLIFLCGHYEGIDARVEEYVDECLSIGDYVLTGGELASMVIADSVIRLCQGVISNDSVEEESFDQELLEYPQYTQPAVYDGHPVPEILLSGHHENIRKWRLLQSLLKTREIRPDLFEKHQLTKEEKKLLDQWDDPEQK
ncbi:MAG: tRNA (guanosine(37)-N1)-methyltransferase TrmD [Solobacterium sp.]|nr:tRNA (guanosine(37)-N1)-methyltransferase TrmD [Solobacterium sp.]